MRQARSSRYAVTVAVGTSRAATTTPWVTSRQALRSPVAAATRRPSSALGVQRVLGVPPAGAEHATAQRDETAEAVVHSPPVRT
jgi:hypothetical protein